MWVKEQVNRRTIPPHMLNADMTRLGGIAPEKTAAPSSKCLNESCPGPLLVLVVLLAGRQEVEHSTTPKRRSMGLTIEAG